jgi:hypothetical protein
MGTYKINNGEMAFTKNGAKTTTEWKLLLKTGKKSHLFIWKESGCDLNKGNDKQKGSCVKPTPSELAVLTTQKGILKE